MFFVRKGFFSTSCGEALTAHASIQASIPCCAVPVVLNACTPLLLHYCIFASSLFWTKQEHMAIGLVAKFCMSGAHSSLTFHESLVEYKRAVLRADRAYPPNHGKFWLCPHLQPSNIPWTMHKSSRMLEPAIQQGSSNLHGSLHPWESALHSPASSTFFTPFIAPVFGYCAFQVVEALSVWQLGTILVIFVAGWLVFSVVQADWSWMNSTSVLPRLIVRPNSSIESRRL